MRWIRPDEARDLRVTTVELRTQCSGLPLTGARRVNQAMDRTGRMNPSDPPMQRSPAREAGQPGAARNLFQ